MSDIISYCYKMLVPLLDRVTQTLNCCTSFDFISYLDARALLAYQ